MRRATHTTRSGFWSTSMWSIGCVILVVLGLTACASNQHDNSRPDSALSRGAGQDIESSAELIEALKARADEQEVTAKPVQNTGVQRPWMPRDVRSDGAAEASATLDLAEILSDIRNRPLFAGDMARAAVDESSQDQALRLYVQARVRSGEGDGSGALSLLERAARLDPSSAQIWSELGQAQIRQGLRSSGVSSLRQAAANGADDLRIWALVGMDAARRRNIEEATRWLAEAYARIDNQTDPYAVAWISVSLGELLLEQGSLRAGIDLIEPVLRRDQETHIASPFASEYAVLVRRHPLLWMSVADAQSELADWAGAAAGYERAAAYEGMPRDELERRRMYCLYRLGRTAEASLIAIAALSSGAGHAEASDLEFLSALGQHEPLLHRIINALASSGPGGLPSQRTAMLFAQIATLSNSSWKHRVALVPSDLRLSPQLILALTTSSQVDTERWEIAVRLAALQPEDVELIADALCAVPVISTAELKRLSSRSPTDLLSLAVQVRLGVANRKADLEALAALSPMHRVLALRIGSQSGRWEDVQALFEGKSDGAVMLRARALAAAGRLGEAVEILSADDAAVVTSVNDGLWAMDVVADAGAVDAQDALVRRLIEIDPRDERSIVRAVEMVLGASAGAKSESLRVLLLEQDLVRNSVRARVREQLAMIERARFGAESIRLLQRLIDLEMIPHDEQYSSCFAYWATLDDASGPAALEEAESWLRSRIDRDRPEEAASLALARLLVLMRRGEEGLALLDDPVLASTPRVERTREFVLRSLGRGEEAMDRAIARLGTEPRSVEELLELLALQFDRGESLDDVLEELAKVPPWVQVRSSVREAMLVVAGRLSGEVLNAQTDTARHERAGQFVTLIEFVSGRHALPMPEPMHRFRLACLSMLPNVTLDSILSAADSFANEHGQVSEAAFAETFGALLQTQRTQESLIFAAHATTNANEFLADRWRQMLLPLATLGTIATVDRVLVRLAETGQIAAAVDATRTDDHPGDIGPTDDRAEIAYVLASIAASRQREAAAALLYQKALEFQADHPWVCNDYAYFLIERDQELSEAERLVQIAYAKLTTNGNVLDTYGWLRYRQGRFADGEYGLGAVSLLARAALTTEGVSNPTIQNHLGDARWRDGDAAGASEAWVRAEVLYLARQRTYQTTEQRRLPEYSRLEVALRNVREKLRAVEAGGRPPVAPIVETGGQQ